MGDTAGSSGIENYDDDDEILERIYGYTEEDVGWTRLVADTLVDAEFYKLSQFTVTLVAAGTWSIGDHLRS